MIGAPMSPATPAPPAARALCTPTRRACPGEARRAEGKRRVGCIDVAVSGPLRTPTPMPEPRA
jgi:hypothetical protein